MDVERDPDWLARLQALDAAAFGQLVELYERPLFRVAYRMLGNPAEAADVTQDAFLKVFENMATFDPQHRLFSWIYRIAVNTALDRLKHRQYADVAATPVDTLPLPDSVHGPVEQVEDSQLHDAVQAAIMELQGDYRAVIVLRHFSGFSYGQMAEILDIPEKTIKSRLYSARQALRVKLCARGVAPA